MSLSAEEKVRVAHALDDLGMHMIEAGFPASNPKEAELFDLLSRERFQTAEVAAFGMTRRRDVAADQDAGLRVLADSFAPVCTIVGKTWSLHLEKVTQVEPEENLRMIADSVAFLTAGRQARRLRRRALLRRLPRRPRLRAALPARRRRGRRGQRHALRHQRLLAAEPDLGRHRGGGGCARRRRGRHPHPRRRRLRRRQRARGGRGGRPHGPGHGQRLRRALRQRQPDHDRARPRAEARLRVHRPRQAARA